MLIDLPELVVANSRSVGVDIIAIERIRQAENNTKGFSARILTPNEHKEMEAKRQPSHYLAKRFAAKEAISKALGTGIGSGVSWQDIEINNDDKGAPKVTLRGQALAMLQAIGGSNCLLSLSDEREVAIAFAVIS